METSTKKRKVVKTVTEDYALSLTLGGQTYKGSGPTPYDALHALTKPDKLTSKGVLTVSRGTAKKDMFMLPVRLRRLFYPAQSIQMVQARMLFSTLK